MRYQQQIQEDFFSVYHIEDVTEHVVRSGESLWILSQRRYNVPVWLLRQYNPGVDFDRVSPGTVVRFPTLRKISDDA
jgi:membrane-bound lytic murein transglycosylase D